MIKFGVAGNSLSFYEEGHKSTVESALWCKNRGIDLFEYSFGKGINISDTTAFDIGVVFNFNEVELSVHAPYFINFANPDEEKIQNSIKYVINSIKKAAVFGGNRIVFHPASQGKATREDAVALTYSNLKRLADIIKENEMSNFIVCPETMGKFAQIGTVEEIVDFCNIAPFFYPCFDFGHINSRTLGELKSPADFERIINYSFDNLPAHKVKNMHVHFSKIMYGGKGELMHLTFADDKYGPNFEDFSEIIHKYKLEPYIVCESDGTQAEDAMYMKNYYFSND